jgi:DNA topoisomerase I
MTILVIVESPGKIKKIQSYLGNDYIVKASFGHIRDLNSKELSIDVNNNFNPQYQIMADKRKVVKELLYQTSQCDKVILATDEDREGEAIAQGLMEVLKLKNPDRIVFHEITKDAIKNALDNPSKIDNNMVMAQQARRLLDRLVGYKISPLLWKTMKGQLSAGRVQSVVVKIVVDKENEINTFLDSDIGSYYKTTSEFELNYLNTNNMNIKCNLVNEKGDVFKINMKDIEGFLNKFSKKTKYEITDIIKSDVTNTPSKPFITSTLQQDASTKLGFTSKRTMMAAQKLYEGGHITYMRTDSYNLSKESLKQCQNHIHSFYGEKYYKYRTFAAKSKNAQEAHEAIRPTKISTVSVDMENDCNKVYDLIWKRTLASQMADATIERNNIYIDCINNNINKDSILPAESLFLSTLETIKFNGFLILYGKENEDSITIDKNADIKFKKINVTEEYNKPPLRYNEAGLIKYLEKNGIGRPSTYSSIISKILDREYVKVSNIDGIEQDSNTYELSKSFKLKIDVKKIKLGSEKKKMIPTPLGTTVNDFMSSNFINLMNIDYTAKFEKLLDKIANGKAQWYNVLREYYDDFNPIVEKLSLEAPKVSNGDKTDIYIGKHPDNNFDIYSMIGRYGLCVKMIEIIDGKENYKYAKVLDYKQEDINLDMAVKLFEYPKLIGNIGKGVVNLYKGQYGFYIKMGKKTASVKDENITIQEAKELLEREPGAIKTFDCKGKKVYLKKGQYGYYLNYKKNGKNVNKALPKNIDIEKLDSIDLSNINI